MDTVRTAFLQPIAVSIAGATEVSGLGRTAIFEAIREGDLPAKKYGRRTIILVDALGDFLRSLPDREINAASGGLDGSGDHFISASSVPKNKANK